MWGVSPKSSSRMIATMLISSHGQSVQSCRIHLHSWLCGWTMAICPCPLVQPGPSPGLVSTMHGHLGCVHLGACFREEPPSSMGHPFRSSHLRSLDLLWHACESMWRLRPITDISTSSAPGTKITSLELVRPSSLLPPRSAHCSLASCKAPSSIPWMAKPALTDGNGYL